MIRLKILAVILEEMEEGMRIYNRYKSNPKIEIYSLIKGEKGFDIALETLFKDDVSEGKEWAKQWTAAEKRNAVYFTYKRKLISKYKVGLKLIIGDSVIGETHYV